MYYKSTTGLDILDNTRNISAISKIIDVDYSLDVDFNEIQVFFDKYVKFENLKIKDVLIIPILEKKPSIGPVFSLALKRALSLGQKKISELSFENLDKN